MQYIVELDEQQTKCKTSREFAEYVKNNLGVIDEMLVYTPEGEELSAGEVQELIDQALEKITGGMKLAGGRSATV